MSSVSVPSSPWNFNAGPGALPAEVLEEATNNLQQYGGPFPSGAGISVMCMSHRSAPFEAIMKSALKNCRDLLQIPDTHTVLFLHGGGTGGFASVPLNLTKGSDDVVSYAVTGTWSSLAAKEAAKYAKVEVLVETKDSNGGYTTVPDASTWKQASAGSKYLALCYNETQHGVAFSAVPSTPNLPPLVADMSSCFMSEPVDVSKFAVIYAGAQKNVGPAGVTVYIVRKDLLTGSNKLCPSVFDWKLYDAAGSMYNTPCTWSIYIMNLVFEWIKKNGGLPAMKLAAEKKSQLIYDAIDGSGGFYRSFVQGTARSKQNICFFISSSADGSQDKKLQDEFVKQSEATGFVGLQGHRSVGALRASVYNGLPEEGCRALVAFMKQFQQKHQAQ